VPAGDAAAAGELTVGVLVAFGVFGVGRGWAWIGEGRGVESVRACCL